MSLNVVKAIPAGILLVGQHKSTAQVNEQSMLSALSEPVCKKVARQILKNIESLFPGVPAKVHVAACALSQQYLEQCADTDLVFENFARMCEQSAAKASACVVGFEDFCHFFDHVSQDSGEESNEDEPQSSSSVIWGCLVPVAISLPIEISDDVAQSIYEMVKESAMEDLSELEVPQAGELAHSIFQKGPDSACLFGRLWFFEQDSPVDCLDMVVMASKSALIKEIISAQSVSDKSHFEMFGAVPVASDKKGNLTVGFCTPEQFCAPLQAESLQEMEELYCQWHAQYCKVIGLLQSTGLSFSAVSFDPWSQKGYTVSEFLRLEKSDDFIVYQYVGNPEDEQGVEAQQIVHCSHQNPENGHTVGVVICAYDEEGQVVHKSCAYIVNPFNEAHLDYLSEVNSNNAEVQFSEQSGDLQLAPSSFGLDGPFVINAAESPNTSKTLH